MCLSKHFCHSASTTRKQHLIRYICKSVQTKNSKMNPHQPPEPRNDFLEEVCLWKRPEHRDADVKIMYNSRSRGEPATNLLCISKIHLLSLIVNFNLARFRGRHWLSCKQA